MSVDWVRDIAEMHQKYGVHEWIKNNPEKLEQLLHFRVAFLKEEFDETFKATGEKDAEEIVDGLIDLCVVAIGTLDVMGIDADEAWYNVHKANMAKEVGVKESRPNPLGLPDLIKPEDWKAPDHTGNHGLLVNL